MNNQHEDILRHKRKPGGWHAVGRVLHALYIVAAILGAAFLLESLL